MMETMLGLLGPATEVGKCIAAPMKRQFTYLCCFNSNIQKLSEEAKKLEEERIGLQMEVETAINNAQVVDAKVESWLKEVNEVQEKMSQLETEISNIQGGGCLSVKSRYSASKAAVKTAEAMKQKREDRRDIIFISHRPPPAASVVLGILERPTSEFRSRQKIEEDMMATLKDENVKIMGMCGMGGVGKTTLAEKIKNRVLKENVFAESLMVIASQPKDKQKIQGQIAEKLGLKLEETSLSGRAERLCNRLMSGNRILLVLDDVWEYLDLMELGIPCKSGPCTILLTSRDRGVLARMNAQPIYAIDTLTTSEAWSLFKEKLGTCVDDQNEFSGLAQEIANECKGLPLALVSVAGVLKDEKKISVWRDALVQLRSSNPEDLSDVLNDVYTPIKLSYNCLTSQNARSVFLLCCLFPEDFNIPLDHLFAYAIGLSMFEGIRNLEQARDKIVSLVEMLKSRFLLLEGRDEGYVRMHDLVRDVAIFIASKENHLIKCGYNSTWISPFLGERIELSNEVTFPNLRLLMLQGFEISGISFEGMKGLNVLYVSYNVSLTSLPHTTQFLKGLQTLILEKSIFLMNICGIGELINLEILICRDCERLKELPPETMRLKRLRLLEISECEALKNIRPGVIASLEKLEELKIIGSFKKWEAKNKERENENVCLNELEYLSNLTRLEIEVEDSNLAAQQISVPTWKLEKYSIIFGCKGWRNYNIATKAGKVMFLELPGGITVGKWLHECVASVEVFLLRGDGSNNLDLSKAQNIRWLRLAECSTASSVVRCGATVVFPRLERIFLQDLKNLEEICDIHVPNSELSSSSHNSFENLKELSLMKLPTLKRLWKTGSRIVSLYNNLSSIEVFYCERLLNLVPLSTASDCFPQLESLRIGYCDMMEQVFSWKEEESRRMTITFPKLKKLYLRNLSSLKVFYQGIESIEFPLLSQIEIKHCPKLKVLVPNTRGICIGHGKKKVIVNDTLLCPQIPIGSFAQLEELRITEECGSIKSLFSFSIAQNLERLKLLEISKCEKMEDVIDEEGSDESSLVFSHLETLLLSYLPKLKTFCKSSVGFPKLVILEIRDCPELGGFNLGCPVTSSSLESLESVRIRGCWMMQQVFLWREQENGHTVTFSKLTRLDLFDLARLTTLYKGAETIEFPLLSEMTISKCPNLTTLVSKGDMNNEVKELTAIWNQIPIGRLEWLSICGYDDISSLFPSAVATNLINLKSLEINYCNNMVKVIEEEEEEYSSNDKILFPHLSYIYLYNLPKLKIVCDWKCALKMPSLGMVAVMHCPKLERFSVESLSTPNLYNLRTENSNNDIRGGDLNHVLHQHLIRLKEETTLRDEEENKLN